MSPLEARVAALEERNRAKDANKSWETSWARFTVVCALTYALVALYMWAAGLKPLWLNAVVPAAAYAISTITIAPAQRAWARFVSLSQ